MNSQELIESYVHEVGQHLPRRMRADIELELRSLLADALEERGDDETAVIDFLKELGSPAQFAAQYLPNQYLIGPNLFPTFKMVGTIIFTVITIFTIITIGYTITRFGVPESTLSWWGEEMNEYVRSLIFTFGLLTAVFVFLERVGVGDPSKQEAWDPTSLRPIKDPNRIDRADLITSIVGAAVSIWVFLSLPDWIGTEGGGLFSAGYLVHTPWLIATWVLEIVHKFTVLRDGRWLRSTRLFAIALNIFDVYVLYRIISGPILINVELFDSLMKGAISIALIVIIVDTVFKAYKLITAPKVHPVEVRSKAA